MCQLTSEKYWVKTHNTDSQICWTKYWYKDEEIYHHLTVTYSSREDSTRTWLMSVCEPLRADTKGSISIGRYGSSELSLTGTVRHSSTNRSFICCLCSPDCRLFRPTTNQPSYWLNINCKSNKPNIYMSHEYIGSLGLVC